MPPLSMEEILAMLESDGEHATVHASHAAQQRLQARLAALRGAIAALPPLEQALLQGAVNRMLGPAGTPAAATIDNQPATTANGLLLGEHGLIPFNLGELPAR